MVSPEARENSPDLKDSGKILTMWCERAQRYEVGKPGLDHFWYNQAEALGKESLKVVCSEHGEKPALKLLDLVDGLNLETQANLLFLGKKDAPTLIEASETSLKQLTLQKLIQNFRHKSDNLHFQEGIYRKVVKKMLEIKFPGQKASELMKKFPSASSRPVGFLTREIDLALQKGPDVLLEAFNFIPPEEIESYDFDKRLEFEKRARSEGQMPVTRIYKFTGAVQAVGFRDFCGQRSANLWGKSFVNNEEDGSVTLILQGLPGILDEYMSDFCQAATKNLGIPLPTMSLEKEDPMVRGKALKKLFKR